jgi:tetratricopeptide (TPR) repeat protein
VTSALLTLLFAAGTAVGYLRPQDIEYVRVLEMLYDGSTDTAIESFQQLAQLHPEDPAALYLGAVALCWKIEQNPRSTRYDEQLLDQVDRCLKLTDRLLRENASDIRARLARGGAFGARSRYHIFRENNGAARRDAIAMRTELARVRSLDPDNVEASFGLGLYDYYADVLPRLLKLLRFLVGMPAGNRERGLRLIDQASRNSLFHSTEARIQIYEIYRFYEPDADRAYQELLYLRKRYPGAPLWGLKLAEHLRDQLGLYEEAVRVTREIVDAVERGHPNYAPIVADMARLSQGEALLLDHRHADAWRVLVTLQPSFGDRPVLRSRAQYLLGRCLEFDGQREAAMVQYRKASSSPDKEIRHLARISLSNPLSVGAIESARLLEEANKLARNGEHDRATAIFRRVIDLDPEQPEALLAIAEDEIHSGELQDTERALKTVLSNEHLTPPWLRAWAHLLLGNKYDLDGARQQAVQEYEEVVRAPFGRDDLRAYAERALQHPYLTIGRDGSQ